MEPSSPKISCTNRVLIVIVLPSYSTPASDDVQFVGVEKQGER